MTQKKDAFGRLVGAKIVHLKCHWSLFRTECGRRIERLNYTNTKPDVTCRHCLNRIEMDLIIYTPRDLRTLGADPLGIEAALKDS